MAAGMGFFIARPSRIVVSRASVACLRYSLLCGVSRRENVPPAPFHLLTHDLLRRSLGTEPISKAKRKGSTLCYLFFLVAGMGFEPHDLRVMRAPIQLRPKIHRVDRTYRPQRIATGKATNEPRKHRNKFGRLGVAFSLSKLVLTLGMACSMGRESFLFFAFQKGNNSFLRNMAIEPISFGWLLRVQIKRPRLVLSLFFERE